LHLSSPHLWLSGAADNLRPVLHDVQYIVPPVPVIYLLKPGTAPYYFVKGCIPTENSELLDGACREEENEKSVSPTTKRFIFIHD
jgi:hypothetical protein